MVHIPNCVIHHPLINRVAGIVRRALVACSPALREAGMLVEGDPDVLDGGRWQDEWLYARAYTIAGGSSEIMRNLIAERGLALPRDRR